MPRLPVDLRSVRTKCQKKGCSHHDATLQRHHRGSQKLFVYVFASRTGELRYDQFVKRYYAFRRKDCSLLCEPHHQEIHAIYRPIISKHKWRNRRPLHQFTWRQANDLMRELITAHDRWIKRKTPGILTVLSHQRR